MSHNLWKTLTDVESKHKILPHYAIHRKPQIVYLGKYNNNSIYIQKEMRQSWKKIVLRFILQTWNGSKLSQKAINFMSKGCENKVCAIIVGFKCVILNLGYKKVFNLTYIVNKNLYPNKKIKWMDKRYEIS